VYKIIIKRVFRITTLILVVVIGAYVTPTMADTAKTRDKMPVFECLIQPDELVHVSSPILGVLDEVYVDDSDKVSKGQKLARLESSIQKAVVDVAKAKANRQDEIHLRETDLAFTKRKLARIKELHDKHSISPSENDRAETAVALAKIELQKAHNENEMAKLEYKKAQRALDRRTIRSPINGIIVTRTASPGEFVEETPIFTIAKVEQLKVELIVPVEYFGLIKPGMKARVIPEIVNTSEYTATVSVVDKVIDAPSGTFSVRLSLPNPGQSLPGGLKCQAKILP
jgi:RND family efflux transporter MFP subunit